MTEPNSGTEQAASGAANTGAAEQVVNTIQVNENAGGVSNALRGLVSEETLAQLENLNSGESQEAKPAAAVATQTETAAAAGTGEEEENPETKETKTAGADDANVDKNKTDGDKPVKKNVLGIGAKKQEKAPAVVIENTDQLLGVIKTKFGQELKEVTELPKFLESVEKWRTDSQKVEEISATNEKYESILSGLPPEIINAMELHYSAQDYMQAFANRPKFNFDVPVEKQDSKALVEHYFPGKFTDEDFAEETPSQALEIALVASKTNFNVEKQTKDVQRATIAENARKQLDLYKASVVSSVNNLKQAFPDTDANELKNIQKTLEGGSNAIVQLFFNQDGSLKETAAKAVLLAVHGESVINDMMELSSHVTETKLNEEILSRGNETRSPKKGNGGGEQQISEGAKKILNELNKFKENKTF
jgi:hypothetical protein